MGGAQNRGDCCHSGSRLSDNFMENPSLNLASLFFFFFCPCGLALFLLLCFLSDGEGADPRARPGNEVSAAARNHDV